MERLFQFLPSRCSVCDATGQEMSRNKGPFNPVSPERLEFGISPLHFMLRTFELLLHIGYKQDIKKFKTQGPDEKSLKEARETKVKKAFMTELCLTVDMRREGGFGNTNTGNVARKALENPVTTAHICGVSPMLVSNLDTIRRILSSPYDIDSQAFESFCQETLDIYMSDAGWYQIPPTLHRVLVHGRAIIEATPVRIGLTSEEGSESNTKFARNFYKNHTRKSSQENTMSDLFFRLLDCSDPFILAGKPLKSEKPVPKDLLQLVIQKEKPETDITQTQCVTSESGNESFSRESYSSGESYSSSDTDSFSESDKDSTRTQNPSLESISFNVSLCDS